MELNLEQIITQLRELYVGTISGVKDVIKLDLEGTPIIAILGNVYTSEMETLIPVIIQNYPIYIVLERDSGIENEPNTY